MTTRIMGVSFQVGTEYKRLAANPHGHDRGMDDDERDRDEGREDDRNVELDDSPAPDPTTGESDADDVPQAD
jgi:hypothetical protein